MPLSAKQEQIVRIRGGSRGLVTSMCSEIEGLRVELSEKDAEERATNLNDMIRCIARVRATLAIQDRRFEEAEDELEPLTLEEWEKEMAGRNERSMNGSWICWRTSTTISALACSKKALRRGSSRTLRCLPRDITLLDPYASHRRGRQVWR